jgi:hypothetical protein
MVEIFRASQYALPIVQEALRFRQSRRDLDAAQRAQRRGRRARRGERHEGGDEPLPQDRIRPALLGDRLDGRQFAHLSSKRAQLYGKGVQRMSLNRATFGGGTTDGGDPRQSREGEK